MKQMLRLLTFFSLVTFFLSGSFYTTDTVRGLQPYMLIGSIGVLLTIFIIYGFPKLKMDFKLFSVFMVFSITSILSAMWTASPDLIIGSLVLMYIYIGVVVILPSIFWRNAQNGKKIIIQSIVIGHIPIILFPMLLEGVKLTSYKGIFYNPNSFGGVVTTLFAAVLSGFAFLLEEYMISSKKLNGKAFTLQLSLLVGLFVLIIISSSRTSFVTAIVLLFIVASFLLSKATVKAKINIKPAKKIIIITCCFVFLTIVAYHATPFGSLIETSVIQKFEAKSRDLLDGRLYVWMETIKETSLLGHGRDYFGQIGLGAHSTYISILGQYGFVPLLFFIVFLFQHLMKCVKYAYKTINDEYKYLPVLAVSNFMILSIAEGMLLKSAMLLLFSTIGVLKFQSPTIK